MYKFIDYSERSRFTIRVLKILTEFVEVWELLGQWKKKSGWSTEKRYRCRRR